MIAKAELNKIINDLTFDVNKLLWINLSAKVTGIAEEKLLTYDGFLFTAERKYEVGASSNLELLSSKINKIKIENEIKVLNPKSEFINHSSGN